METEGKKGYSRFEVFVELNQTIGGDYTNSTQYLTIHNTELVDFTTLYLGRITRGNVKARV